MNRVDYFKAQSITWASTINTSYIMILDFVKSYDKSYDILLYYIKLHDIRLHSIII